MNKSEFELMISLVDEKYVDEIFEDRIYGKRKNIFISFAAAAAALTVTIGGISYFVSNAGNDDIAVTDRSVVMIDDLNNTEVTNVTEVVVPIDCEEIFRNKSDEYPISFYCNWDNEFGNDSQNAFDIDYVKSIIPFSAEGYSDSRNQAYAYCDGNNEPFGVSMYFESEFDETASPKFRSIEVYICTAGHLVHDFPLEETEPVNCFGTDIYGFDDTAHYYEGAYDRKLKAYFVMDGMEYAVGTSNLSCEETVNIIRDIIQSGFSIKDFDLTAGSDFDYEVTDISIEEANKIDPFAGYIPQINNVLLPYKGPTYDIVKINGEIYCQSLSLSYTDGTNSGNGRRILFEYYTRSTGRGAKPFDNTIDLPEISLENLNDLAAGDEYKFTINCYSFMINVTAKCTVNELWAYIDNIKGDTYKNTITLAEASASTPFAEFLPKTEKIGDLTVGNIYLEKEKGWENPTLTLDYSSQGRLGTFSYYGIVYHMDSQRVLENVIALDNITKSDIEKLAVQPNGTGNNKNFEFSIDCGGIWINIHGDCTVDEIWAFIENITGHMQDTVTLAEAKAIEPFAAYVPERESGGMKLEKGILNYYDKEPMSLHFTFSEGTDSLVIAYLRDIIDLSQIPDEYIVPAENIDWTAVNNFVKNKNAFYIDCGKIIILIDAECPAEQVWFYIEQIIEPEKRMAEKIRQLEEQEKIRAEEENRHDEASETDSGNTKDIITISISKLKELAKKGDNLMWSDFDGYDFVDIGSGLYIRSYGVEGGYSLLIGGGSLDEKPMYIYLDSKTKRIDIRYDSIDDIIG